jgi:predicted nucleic acid-binding protein
MAIYFFDTSALVKRHAPENGTKWVQGLTDPASRNLIYISRLTGAEVIAAIKLNVRSGETTEADANC